MVLMKRCELPYSEVRAESRKKLIFVYFGSSKICNCYSHTIHLSFRQPTLVILHSCWA